MATSTSFLGLILPGSGEYKDVWDGPLNDNLTAIDAWAAGVDNEIIEARHSEASLKDFLDIAHETDGTLKPTDEMASARSSFVYGFEGADPYLLSDRLKQSDLEIWRAREGHATLRDNLATRLAPFGTIVVSGSKDGNGYPTWMGSTANKVQVDGSADELILAVDGKLCRVRTLKELTLSGGAGTKYIYASFQANGEMVVDGDSSSAPPASPSGTTSLNVDGEAVYFNDSTKDFTAEDVKPGDILTLIDSAEVGEYIVKTVAPGSVTSRLEIIGKFPVGGVSSINYTIHDPMAITLGFDTTETPATGKIYLGEAYFDGAAVADFPSETGIKVKPRHFKDNFIGEWRTVDVSSGGGTFEEIFHHRLGSDKLEVVIQASQANDGSQAVEELTIGSLTSTLGVSAGNGTLAIDLDNTYVFSPGTWNEGTTDADYDPLPSLTGGITADLTGAVTASLTGSVILDGSVIVKWDRNRVWVKNAVATKFYKDYGGTARQTGYIRVLVRKRG